VRTWEYDILLSCVTLHKNLIMRICLLPACNIHLNNCENLTIWLSATMCNIYTNILENLIMRSCLLPACNIHLNNCEHLRIWHSATMCITYTNNLENLIMRSCLLPACNIYLNNFEHLRIWPFVTMWHLHKQFGELDNEKLSSSSM
jgi:hypothetical protein